MTTKELLETYYDGLARKSGWESVISDDFKFVGGDMTKTTPVVGRPAYIEITASPQTRTPPRQSRLKPT